MKDTLFVFGAYGQKGFMYQEMICPTEEEARREAIYILNGLHDFYPRKLVLIRSEPWEPPTLKFD